MDLKKLMSGIAVVIDDALDRAATSNGQDDQAEDLIMQIVEQLQQKLGIPFHKIGELPQETTWHNLLQAASFILLDWKLWPDNDPSLERFGIKSNIQFLQGAKDYFVPIFIFTNEHKQDVIEKLPREIYDPERPERNFIFLQSKAELMADGVLKFGELEDWMRGNASVYVLKTWEHAFYTAKRELFSSMYKRDPHWPRIFWKAYEDDGVDASSSLTHLINDNLLGRMSSGDFEPNILAINGAEIDAIVLRELIRESSFLSKEKLANDEVRCGDIFRDSGGRFWLNLRPDCDCIPRNGTLDEVELYCIRGKSINERKVRNLYVRNQGHFQEAIWQSIVFAVLDRGKSIEFDFKKIRIEEYGKLKDNRIGRLLHPYLTRIQQRYALYLQRQGLPRIPDGAVPETPDEEGKGPTS